jgi:formylmethanofuran dehydrogenase subunit E
MRPFADMLDETTKIHGHMCPGQVLGVRMAVAGCREVGIDEPQAGKSLIVFVEIDRCAADAIQAVTGCSLGKRSLKYLDYGKMAATFLNTKTGEAVRVVALEESRERAKVYVPEEPDRHRAQTIAYQTMPEEELLRLEVVGVSLAPMDQPGSPLKRVLCELCHEGINDGREVVKDGRVLCRACAEGAYYSRLARVMAV